MGKPDKARAQLELVSNIKKVYEANGVSMDAEIKRMMEKAGFKSSRLSREAASERSVAQPRSGVRD